MADTQTLKVIFEAEVTEEERQWIGKSFHEWRRRAESAYLPGRTISYSYYIIEDAKEKK